MAPRGPGWPRLRTRLTLVGAAGGGADGRLRQLQAADQQGAYGGIEEQLDAEAEAQREQGHTADFIEGVLAFVEKRPAEFKGS